MPLVVALLVVSFLLTWVATPRFSRLLQAGGALRKNYAGEPIPTAAGISIVASVTVTYFLAAIISSSLRMEVITVLAVILAMGTLGLIDDLLGTRDTTGIKGHLYMLLKGKLTTGGLKALGGGGLALGFSLIFFDRPADIVVSTCIIALFTNAINLMDLRPGRAGKVFLFLGLFLLVPGVIKLHYCIFWLVPVYGSVLAFLPFDLKGRVMMGDTGSNVLGITLGMASVVLLSMTWKAVILGLLIFLHIYTEKYSLTETIKRIPFLRVLDEWGTAR